MSKIDEDGGTAFPSEYDSEYSYERHTTGMSLRDYFAAEALKPLVLFLKADMDENYPAHCASHAYEMADAMLAERAKGRTP